MELNYLIVMPSVVSYQEQSYFFPIGMAYVSASLKQTKRKVHTFNLNYKKGSIEENLRKVIDENNIDVVMTGGLTGQYPLLMNILAAVKRIKPEAILCVGGGIITSSPVYAMDAMEIVDYGMIGEGEITVCELAEALEGKRDIHSVDGLIFKENGKWVVTAQRKEITDLDSLPFPDYEGFEYDQLLDKQPVDLATGYSKRIGYVCFSRSCPFSCTFCFHPSGSKYRRRSIESVFKEIDYLIEKYQIKSLSTGDELFAARMDDVREFCEQIKKRHLTFEISMRVDMVNAEMLTLLRDSGCTSVSFGLESADNSVLASMKKHITIEQIEHALNLCNEVGIPAYGNFIFGDPAETYEKALNTINWWKAHPQFPIKLVTLLTFPGSEVFKTAVSKGVIKDPVQYIKDGCPFVNVSNMSDDEYREISIMTSMLSRKNPNLLTNTEIEYEFGGRVTLRGICPKCGATNEWIGLEAFRSVRPLLCKECKCSVEPVPATYYKDDLLYNNWKLLASHKTALWSVIPSVSALFEKIPEATTTENLFLIDKSPIKQGGSFMSKTVHSPDIIAKEGIDIVLLSFTSMITREIVDEINASYPTVKHILFLGELFSEGFKDSIN